MVQVRIALITKYNCNKYQQTNNYKSIVQLMQNVLRCCNNFLCINLAFQYLDCRYYPVTWLNNNSNNNRSSSSIGSSIGGSSIIIYTRYEEL